MKKKYRDLSKKFHPDRGGDEKQFDRIAKAYQALTDDESRKNWEQYGNPDGPGGIHVSTIFWKQVEGKIYSMAQLSRKLAFPPDLSFMLGF